ncbi:hypothetical protein CRUP_004561 [Coryphaenoides rupestris]|nr:hypothetical protein CRUP_004561 [Coryphaenoides rupestris]
MGDFLHRTSGHARWKPWQHRVLFRCHGDHTVRCGSAPL